MHVKLILKDLKDQLLCKADLKETLIPPFFSTFDVDHLEKIRPHH